MRVHNVTGGEITEVTGAIDDDEGAPPAMPPGGRLTTVGNDGELPPVSPQTPEEFEQKKQEAAARIAAGKVRKPKPAPVASPAFDDPGKTLRARCLEIAARGDALSPAEIIMQARELYQFVENG